MCVCVNAMSVADLSRSSIEGGFQIEVIACEALEKMDHTHFRMCHAHFGCKEN